MAVTNTGVVLRTITGVHDANFVHPIGDEGVLNGDFSNGSTDWTLGTGWSIGDDKLIATSMSNQFVTQSFNFTSGKRYMASFSVTGTSSLPSNASLRLPYDGDVSNIAYVNQNSDGVYSHEFVAANTLNTLYLGYGSFTGTITNISVKEVLVNRESTTTNTGIVERSLTGVNESDLWLDSESTSVVNNTGIVERPITGVNESDALFPDNTDSTVVNITQFIIPLLTDLEARATTFENREATQNILINLQKC